MTNLKTCNVLIIGSGPAGYTAAIYAARANLQPVVVEGLQAGGQLTSTTDVENYSGFADPIQGPWLMEQMRQQALNVGVELVGDIVTGIDTSTRPFKCTTDSGLTYAARTVIVSTGAQAKWLGLDSEAKFNGRGVSACATCDGFFFRNRRVAVVGGGNTAVEEALYLSAICNEVVLVHRRDTLRAEKVLQDRLQAKANISVEWNKRVDEILGDDNGVNALALRDTRTGAQSRIEVDGVFVAIGHSPSTQLLTGKVEIDNDGYVLTEPGTTRTSLPGLFAAGDVQDKTYRQAITAAGTGCMAALDAERFLAGVAH
ncbi:thioredoxin-disulfide reductase [Mesorhizobium sp. Z1-4]|uniref:thioredoxin-disulfide reductase n=1 Tax=Mesorhizobium sp. Z1-4 TaxID=2448478 RepID=UPI000FD6EE72|nr:thioredoxin-disulfide reductase [Mesorhizobium sp. Z1-4]